MSKGTNWVFWTLVAGLLVGATSASAAAFSVSSSSFPDGGMLTKKNAADDPMRMCGGQNVSPALAWSNAPDKTKSFVVFMFDPDGRLGEGVSHWVGYGVPANVTSFAEGEIGKESKKFFRGKGQGANATYL